MVSEINIYCRASSVLAEKFWQTPPELRGTSFAHDFRRLLSQSICEDYKKWGIF
jgi:hypothetical protein